MQIKLDVNNAKANILLEFLELFKKNDMLKEYKIINNQPSTNYDNEVLDDISKIGQALKNAKNGLGEKTSTIVTIKDV